MCVSDCLNFMRSENEQKFHEKLSLDIALRVIVCPEIINCLLELTIILEAK